MSSKRTPYPPKTPAFEVGIGRHADLWFLGIKPSVSYELLVAVGGRALSGWSIEALDESTGVTVLANFDNASHEQASQTAIALTIGMARETGKSGVYSPVVVEMAFNTAPFTALQPYI
jgi:hypothetical protein